MSNVYPLVSAKQRYDEASQWIAKLDRGLTAAETAALQQWMAAQPENTAVLLDMARLWDKMEALSELAALFPAPRERPSRAPVWATAIAASLLVAALAVWFSVTGSVPYPHPAPSEYVYQTGIGEHTRITLADGSLLTLNTNSRVTVEYTDQYRLLTLERGELYVAVAQDPQRPLSVIAGGQIVQAIGTQFSVEITSQQEIELVVVEGKVQVGVHNRAAQTTAKEPPRTVEPAPRLLSAGQATRLGSTKVHIDTVSAADIEVKLSWRQGNLIFRGESLEEAVREVERYTPVEFVFLDPELKQIRVAGLFKAGDVDGLLATLRENFNIVYQYTDEQKVLLRKP